MSVKENFKITKKFLKKEDNLKFKIKTNLQKKYGSLHKDDREKVSNFFDKILAKILEDLKSEALVFDADVEIQIEKEINKILRITPEVLNLRKKRESIKKRIQDYSLKDESYKNIKNSNLVKNLEIEIERLKENAEEIKNELKKGVENEKVEL